MTPVYTLSIETDAGTYQHGLHLGTIERVARDLAETIYKLRKPSQGTLIKSVALKHPLHKTAYFDGEWS